jgi:phosphatidylethanolamine-binding protein (PEBP) family uncharacterized protein
VTTQKGRWLATLICGALLQNPCFAAPKELAYACSQPPLEATFAIAGDHYSGVVACGNLFLQADISPPPVVKWKGAKPGSLYTLMMIDFDGNANGSWPDAVASGQNSPVRHWIVGNIPGDLLRTSGYKEESATSKTGMITVVQSYRSPHIPVVSDRYGLYLFEQSKDMKFATLTGDVINFELASFLQTYNLGMPKASNYFVAVYTSESPFSGKAFHGNDVTGSWHQDLGKGKLTP